METDSYEFEKVQQRPASIIDLSRRQKRKGGRRTNSLPCPLMPPSHGA